MSSQIAIIGAGHLASSIIAGLIANHYSPKQLVASDRNPSKLDRLKEHYGISVATDNSSAIEQADLICLAVKPTALETVCRELAPHLSSDALIVSLAAAATFTDFAQWFKPNPLPLVRVMTNTASQVNAACTAMVANELVTQNQRQTCEQVFAHIGSTHWIAHEANFDAYTALLGCAPAYLYLLIEALSQAAIGIDVPEQLAERMAIETITGAARLAASSDISMHELRKQVATPNGATEHSLRPLLQGDFFALLQQALTTARQRCLDIQASLAEPN